MVRPVIGRQTAATDPQGACTAADTNGDDERGFVWPQLACENASGAATSDEFL